MLEHHKVDSMVFPKVVTRSSTGYWLHIYWPLQGVFLGWSWREPEKSVPLGALLSASLFCRVSKASERSNKNSYNRDAARPDLSP